MHTLHYTQGFFKLQAFNKALEMLEPFISFLKVLQNTIKYDLVVESFLFL